MKMNKKWVIIGVIGLVVVGVAYTSLSNPAKVDKNSNPILETSLETDTVISVSLDTVKNDDLEETIFTIGSIDPVETFNVTAKIPGDVKATYFEIGDHVLKGDILFEINQDTFDISRNQTITQMKNALDQAQNSLKQAQDSYNDQSQLFESGVASQSALDNAKNALDNAQIAYNNAKTNYNSNVSSMNEQLDNYVQKSPVDGIIVSKNISKSIYATSQNGYTIIPESQFVVNASVTSKYVKTIKKGQQAYIYVNTIDKSYEGEVISVSEVGQQGSYPVEISIQGDGELMSGLYSEVKIVTHRYDQVPVISKKALMMEGEDYFVYRVKEDNTVEKIGVILGAESDDKVEVLNNLSVGDKIVILGKEYLSDNDKVVIK